MSRLIATRISDEQYSKIMGKCSGLGCSVYDYLKMLVETDMADAEKARQAKEKRRQSLQESLNELRAMNARLKELRATRRFANILLMSKALREMLPVAIAHADRIKELFAGLMNRVGTGHVSRAYASLYRLFYDWRYFVWVVSSPPAESERVFPF